MISIVNVYLNLDVKLYVGRLALKNRKIYFEYDKSFLKHGIDISPYMLPLKEKILICEDRVFEGLFGVFSDSLPDGWGRLLLDRHLVSKGINYKDITPLDRLCYVGKYGMGALTYEPFYEDFEFKEQKIILDDLADSALEIIHGDSSTMLDTLLTLEGSSAGARPKVMVQVDQNNHIIHGAQQLLKGYEHYIVKFPNSSDDSDIGKTEYIYSLIARYAGIDIPQTKLFQTSKNAYFGIKRFDRVGDKRVHIHSVAGLTHSDFRMPVLDYDELLTLTFHLTKDINEVIKLYRVAVFNLFMHNRDDHAKNFSFLLDANHQWKLAPAYDLTFSHGPGGEHSTTYLGEGKNPTIKHLEQLAKKHTVKNYKQIIEQTKDAVSRFEYLAKDIGVTTSPYKDTIKLFISSF